MNNYGVTYKHDDFEKKFKLWNFKNICSISNITTHRNPLVSDGFNWTDVFLPCVEAWYVYTFRSTILSYLGFIFMFVVYFDVVQFHNFNNWSRLFCFALICVCSLIIWLLQLRLNNLRFSEIIIFGSIGIVFN